MKLLNLTRQGCSYIKMPIVHARWSIFTPTSLTLSNTHNTHSAQLTSNSRPRITLILNRVSIPYISRVSAMNRMITIYHSFVMHKTYLGFKTGTRHFVYVFCIHNDASAW